MKNILVYNKILANISAPPTLLFANRKATIFSLNISTMLSIISNDIIIGLIILFILQFYFYLKTNLNPHFFEAWLAWVRCKKTKQTFMMSGNYYAN